MTPLSLLDPVFDARQPLLMGRFQKWIDLSCGVRVALVKFPGLRARWVHERHLCDGRPRAQQHRAIEDAKERARKIGLSLEQYLEAIA